MIVVTGASGHLGRLVIAALRRTMEPSRIVAGVRTPDKALDLAEAGVVVRRLDYDDPESVLGALEGAERVLLISSSEVGRRVPQHRAVIDAAAATGVESIVYTSLLHADTSGLAIATEHRLTESALRVAALRSSGLGVTLLRNGWYIENYTENLASALEFGTMVGAAGNGRIAAATRADYAAAAAAVLTTGGHEGATYELAGNAFTMTELAAAVSRAVGRTISYTDMTPDDYGDLLAASGVPAQVVEVLVDVDRNVKMGDLDGNPDDLERLIGRAPTALDDVVHAAFAAPPDRAPAA